MFLDGELTTADAEPYLDHLKVCSGCRGLVDGERRFRSVFRSKVIGREQAPEALRQRIVALSGQRQPSRSWRLATATATIGVLIGLTWTTQSGFSPVLQDVADKHREALPMDVATDDLKEAQQFVQKHLPKVKIPKIKRDKAQLEGARVVDLPGHRAVIVRYLVGPNAQPVSVAVYDRGSQNLSLPRLVEAGTQRVFVDRIGSLQAAVWQDRDQVYSMVGELDERQMLQLVSAAEDTW